MGKPRRHHFVPEFIVKNFRNEIGSVWYLDKSKNMGIESRNPRSVHWMPHIYSEVTPDGSYSPRLESAYSKVENFWAPIINKKIDNIRSGLEIAISPEERFIISDFFAHQFKRVPDLWSKLVSYKKSPAQFREEVFQKTYEEEGEGGVLRLKSYKFTDEELSRIMQNALIQALSQPNSNIIEVLNKKDLFFARVTHPKSSFILGSSPIGRWGDTGELHLEHPDVELSMPVSADVVLGFAGAGGSVKAGDITSQAAVRAFNEGIWRRSSAVCARSKKLIESLKRSERRTADQ